METPSLERVLGGYRVKTEAGWHLDVRPLMRLYRLVEVCQKNPHAIGRYWCYTSFEGAVLAALAWEVDGATQPVGWVRRGGART